MNLSKILSVATLLLVASCVSTGRVLQNVGGHTMKLGFHTAMVCDESPWTRPFIFVPSIFPLISVGFPVWSLGYFIEENSLDILKK
jgi:hypothetical protein